MKNKINIELLKELQEQMLWEDDNDYDGQASPRFWTIMDYKKEPTDPDYGYDSIAYAFYDGDYIEFDGYEELKEFILSYEFEETDEKLKEIIETNNNDFIELWEHMEKNYEYFLVIYEKEYEFIAHNTIFFTKKEANEHLTLNKHHYTSKAHTYAMTACRSPQIKAVIELLTKIDLNKIEIK